MSKNLKTNKEHKEDSSNKDIVGDSVAWILSYQNLKSVFCLSKNRYDEIVIKIFRDTSSIKIFKNILDVFVNNLPLSTKNKLFEKDTLESFKLIGIGGYGQVYRINESVCIKLNLQENENYHEYEIPISLAKLDSELDLLVLKPRALVKHYIFTGILNVLQIHILIVYVMYCLEKDIEIDIEEAKKKLVTYHILKEYNYLFRRGDQIASQSYVLYLTIINKYFLPDERIDLQKYLIHLINSFRDKNDKSKVKTRGFLILMPLANGICTRLTINDKTKQIDINGLKASLVHKHVNRMIILQVSLFILIARQYDDYVHNDLKPDNVLVFPTECESYTITYKHRKYLFKEKFIFKIADFDFSVLPNTVPNKKIIGSKLEHIRSWFNDIHYFVHKFFSFISPDEIEADKEFFIALHDKFIFPFCGTPYDKVKRDLLIKKDCKEHCVNGIYKADFSLDIKFLSDFISLDYFKEWRNDTRSVERDDGSSDNEESRVANCGNNIIDNNSSNGISSTKSTNYSFDNSYFSFGGKTLNKTSLNKTMKKKKPEVLDHDTLDLSFLDDC